MARGEKPLNTPGRSGKGGRQMSNGRSKVKDARLQAKRAARHMHHRPAATANSKA